jgi:hypothetical protein
MLRAEFVEMVAETGSTTAPALVRLFDAEEPVLSAVVSVSSSALGELTAEEVEAVLGAVAPRVVLDRARSDAAWLQENRGGDRVPLVVTTYDRDHLDEIRALGLAGRKMATD